MSDATASFCKFCAAAHAKPVSAGPGTIRIRLSASCRRRQAAERPVAPKAARRLVRRVLLGAMFVTMFLQSDFVRGSSGTRARYHARPQLAQADDFSGVLDGCSRPLHASVPLRRVADDLLRRLRAPAGRFVAVVADRQGPHLGDLPGRGLEGLLDASRPWAIHLMLRALRDELEERVANGRASSSRGT